MIMLRARISGVEMPSACRLTTLPEVAPCQLPEVSQDVHYRDNGVFMISGPSISLLRNLRLSAPVKQFCSSIRKNLLRPSRSPLREHTFPQEYDRRRTIPRAAAWPIVSPGLNGSTSQRNNQQIIWPKQFGSLRASPAESARRSQRR